MRAIAQSIMQAQHMVEKEQVSNFATFFTDDRQPTTIDIQLPATHSTAKPDDMVHYRLPLLALVPHSSLVIGEAEVDLDLELGDFEEVDRASDSDNDAILTQTGKAAPAKKRATLMVSASSATKSASRSIAHIKLKLLAAEKTEGLARLIDDVIKGQGMTDLVQPSAEEPGT
ncbi:DUF2589 domain-containing protein [Paraburkholderia humisilvae]